MKKYEKDEGEIGRNGEGEINVMGRWDGMGWGEVENYSRVPLLGEPAPSEASGGKRWVKVQ